MYRREFLRLLAIYFASSAWQGCSGQLSNVLDTTDTQNPLHGMRILDAHAHPNQFHTPAPRHYDGTSTLKSIRAVGMCASCFAVLGDVPSSKHSWSPETMWGAKSQLERGHDLVRSRKIKLIQKTSDISSLLNQEEPPGAILAIEGGDPLAGNPANLLEFYQAGVRIITLVHYRINEIGDIMTETPRHKGLTNAGRMIVQRMQDLGIVVDVAHAHANTLAQIAEISQRPLLDSHTSPCPGDEPSSCRRFRTWKEMETIAKTEGIVCTWPIGTGARRSTFMDWALEILEMKKRLGMEHVGLGTDGGGGLPAFIKGYSDLRDLRKLASAMENVGLSREDIAAYMGGNLYRLLQKCIG
jgi:membrane dipeptidase